MISLRKIIEFFSVFVLIWAVVTIVIFLTLPGQSLEL